MKIVILHDANARIEIINVPENMLNDDPEGFLSEHGYSVNNIIWFAAPIDNVPVVFHDYGTSAVTGEEMHASRDARLKDFSIYDHTQEVKNREQKELADALRRYGEVVDGCHEYHFEGECPIIAAYSWDEPMDVVVLAAKVDEHGIITLLVDEKNDRGNEHEIDADDAFAGHLEFVINEIQ